MIFSLHIRNMLCNNRWLIYYYLFPCNEFCYSFIHETPKSHLRIVDFPELFNSFRLRILPSPFWDNDSHLPMKKKKNRMHHIIDRLICSIKTVYRKKFDTRTHTQIIVRVDVCSILHMYAHRTLSFRSNVFLIANTARHGEREREQKDEAILIFGYYKDQWITYTNNRYILFA